jgi:hypothetical protein
MPGIYVPEQRFRILRIRSFRGLSQRETAERPDSI